MTEVERISDPYKIVFPKLGWEFEVNPTAFTVFGIEIQWYGIIITLGLVLAMLYCFPKMKRRFGIDPDRAIDAVIGGVVGGIIGARTYYVLLRWDEYAWDWKKIINLRGGGLAIYGGLIGAVLVGLIICKIRKVRMLPMLDVAVLGFLIGQGVGRWGNFVNQEAFGTNTDSLFGMTGGMIQQTIIDESAYLDGSMYQAGLSISENYAVHPCFLYESVWCILGFILLSLYSRRRKYDGQILLMYLTWYGIERFFVEGLRSDSLMIGTLRASQVLSAVLVVVSVIIQIIMISKVKRDPERFVLYCNTEESAALIAESEAKKTGDSADAKDNDNNNDKDEEDENSGNSSIIVPEESEDSGEEPEHENIKENENGTDN